MNNSPGSDLVDPNILYPNQQQTNKSDQHSSCTYRQHFTLTASWPYEKKATADGWLYLALCIMQYLSKKPYSVKWILAEKKKGSRSRSAFHMSWPGFGLTIWVSALGHSNIHDYSIPRALYYYYFDVTFFFV